MTLDLFNTNQEHTDEISLDITDAKISVWPGLFSRAEADRLMKELLGKIAWKQEEIRLYGKTHDLPRLTAWYGDVDKTYRYSGIEVDPLPWIPALLEIKQKIELVKPAVTFNSGLLNLYRSGADCVSWHSDDEPELGPEPAIGSVSFGGSRKLQLKHRSSKEKKSIELGHGDYLLMSGKTQRNWLHQVPRTKKVLEPRINITFRQIFSC